MVRIRGSFCWKIYNEEFDGPAPISSSPPQSTASISDSDRITSSRLEQTINEQRSFYERYLFMEKNLELKLLEENLNSPRRDDKVESGSHYSGYTTESNHTQYIKPIETQQESPNNPRTAIRSQTDSRKDSQDFKKTTRVKQILRIMDCVSKKYPNSNDLLSLLCPLCSKPVKCLNKSSSR